MSPRTSPSVSMTRRTHVGKSTPHGRRPATRLTPLASAIAVLAIAGSLATPDAHAQARPFSSGWMAAKGAAHAQATATGRLPNGMLAGMSSAAQQQQQAQQKLNRSVANLGSAAAAIAAQQAAQAAARAAAQNDPSVPDGLAEDGLKIDATRPLSEAWINAKAPVQTHADGRTNVAIEQTKDKAILNWETFNVGKNTTVDFKQQADWAVLNRVNDPQARPSQIQGQIKGDGTVMIANANGVVFSGTSQVNVRNLVAAAAKISDTQFTSDGLYGKNNVATFTQAGGKVEVQAGAQIATHEASSVTRGGGYVLLMGSEVSNAGTITTRKGQAQLAAGDAFIIRKGVGTDANTASTTRGNEVAPQFNDDSTAGAVSNSGLILSREGDITLAGREVRQGGVVIATTTVNTRGTVHLLNSASDTLGQITLDQNATTAVMIEDDGKITALDSQRDALIKESSEQDLLRAQAPQGAFDNYSQLQDRRDQSRIEIVSGGNIVFEGDSLTLATGGQIVTSAARRSFVADQAQLDVSGAVGVQVAMESNNVKINIQGNELRDAPLNRDSGKLFSNDVWIDRRQLVLVPKGTGGYESDRWYTSNGLLEVGGYLGTQGHSIGEWAAQGGTVLLGGSEVITQVGSAVNLAGGTLDVATGYLNQSWLRGSDGRLYSLDKAPADMVFGGVYKGYEAHHARWDITETFYNPMIGPRKRLENGYTVGRDAGRMIVSAPTAVLEGDIVADVFNGSQQSRKRDAIEDGYKQAQTAVAREGALALGQYGALGRIGARASDVRVGDFATMTEAWTSAEALPTQRLNTVWLDAARLSAQELGGLTLATSESIAFERDLVLAHGGTLELSAAIIDLQANVVARSGSVRAGNALAIGVAQHGTIGSGAVQFTKDGTSSVTLRSGATIDTRGLWTNALLDSTNLSGFPSVDGGAVILGRNATVETGALIDASAGGRLDNTGASFGRGGSITLGGIPGALPGTSIGGAKLLGTVRSNGATGGVLSIYADAVLVADAGTDPQDAQLLTPDFFRQGFSSYVISGLNGLRVAKGAAIEVVQPVYEATNAIYRLETGSEIAGVVDLILHEVYRENPRKSALIKRAGADLTLLSGQDAHLPSGASGGSVTIGKDAWIAVDPGRNILVASGGQITVDGQLTAHGGEIAVLNTTGGAGGDPGGLSIWIGETARLDASARAATARDTQNRLYGIVPDGGRIILGSRGGDNATVVNGHLSSPAYVIVREGAVLDVSGTRADLSFSDRASNRSYVRTVASSGGSITVDSYNGLYIEGTLLGRAGGDGAAGGSLNLNLEAPIILMGQSEEVRSGRAIHIAQGKGENGLPADLVAGANSDDLHIGYGRLAADQVTDGGFDSLSVFARSALAFDGDVDLTAGRSIVLRTSGIHNSVDNGFVTIAAPYVSLDGRLLDLRPTELFTEVPSLLPTWPTTGRVTVQANLIDVANLMNVHASKLTLESSGDLRFLAFNRVAGDIGDSDKTLLASSGDIELIARRVYPTTGAVAELHAGNTFDVNGASQHPNNIPDTSVVTIGRPDDAPVSAPYSLFGSLRIKSGTIRQGGNLFAPLGALSLNANQPLDAASQTDPSQGRVDFLQGSLTSVSAKGLTLPYGGTVDGVKYTVDGKDILPFHVLTGTIVTDAQGNFVPDYADRERLGITVSGTGIVTHDGARLDLSGGGDILGAAFTSGRGGSIDVLLSALANAGPGYGFSDNANGVYAIVPGADVAPPAGGYATAWTGSVPGIGEQISIPKGVPGLSAGTYRLLPANYALLPGAFRVEIGARGTVDAGIVPLDNGSYRLNGTRSVADTTIKDALLSSLIVTPSKVLRTYSQYESQGYDAFMSARSAIFGAVRPLLPADAKFLTFNLLPLSSGSAERVESAMRFEGAADLSPAEGGYGGTAAISGPYEGNIVITRAGSSTARSDTSITVSEIDIANIGAPNLILGGEPLRYFQSAQPTYEISGAASVVVESGVTLSAAQVTLGANEVTLKSGVSINTLGHSTLIADTDATGFLYDAKLVVSNGRVIAPVRQLYGRIVLEDDVSLYSKGSILLRSAEAVIDDTVRFGTRDFELALPSINIGTNSSLANAAASGILPEGLLLTQERLDRLLRPDPVTGAPSMKNLVLSAGQSINFYGSTDLSTLNGDGTSSLESLVLNTPAIYGHGQADDKVTVTTDRVVWASRSEIITTTGDGRPVFKAATPGAIVVGGPGTGKGSLAFNAREIVIGYPDRSQPLNTLQFDRLMMGFGDVSLKASERITSNNTNSLSVWRTGANPAGDFDPATYSGEAATLNLVTPLLTGDSGSRLSVYSGGALNLRAPEGAAMADPAKVNTLGASIDLRSATAAIAIDSVVALPSGRLALTADKDILIGDAARIDLAGRSVAFVDVTKHTWGGDLLVESAHGNILLNGGASIDISAPGSDAGRAQFTATDAAAGRVLLAGALLGTGGASHAGGRIDVRAQLIGQSAGSLSSDFALLNTRLTEAGFTEGRSFALKQGNLVIGDELQARVVNVSIDGGSLTVNGRINASGKAPGSIRLAARDDLSLAGTAVLDVHGTALQVDSYGKPIEAKNRGQIELTSSEGWLRLASGATLNLASPDGVGRGRVELNAGRTSETGGNVRIDAAGTVNIAGAESVALNAFWRYSPTDAAGTIVQDNGGVTPIGSDGSVGLNQIDARSVAFINSALANGDLTRRLSGIAGSGFELRPGVEIFRDGVLTVKGDLDLSDYRYGPEAGRDPADGSTYGRGAPMAFVVRASDSLTINGNISDGFEPKPEIPPQELPVDIATDSAVFANYGDIYGLIFGQTVTLTQDWLIEAADVDPWATTTDTAGRRYYIGSVVPKGTTLRGLRILSPAVPKFASYFVRLTESIPAVPATSPDAKMLATGRRSASIRLVAGADLDSSDMRAALPLENLSQIPSQTSFDGLQDIPSSFNLNLATDWGWGSPVDFYASSGSFYLTQDWTVPDSAFYQTIAGWGYLIDTDGKTYAPGSVVRKGTALPEYSPWTGGWLFDASASLPVLATTMTVTPARLTGSVVLNGRGMPSDPTPASVIRTGTGYLDLIAAGDLSMVAPYGIYTAGTQIDVGNEFSGITSQGGYFAGGGGDVRISTGRDLTGYVYETDAAGGGDNNYSVGNWLVRQGGDTALAAWGIKFGRFAGFGSLGGGNLTADIGRNAGVINTTPGTSPGTSTGLLFAVGSSGWVTSVERTPDLTSVVGGTLTQVGGGNLLVRIGDALNPKDGGGTDDLNGSFTNVRGDIMLQAGAVGSVPLLYGTPTPDDPRQFRYEVAAGLQPGGGIGGPVVVIGDGAAVIQARGDLVLGGTGDPGMIYAKGNERTATGPAFSLWKSDSAISLLSAGGNIVPYNIRRDDGQNERWGSEAPGAIRRAMLPPIFESVAADGSLYWAGDRRIELVPSRDGYLELLARNSIYASAFRIGNDPIVASGWSVSGASADLNSTPNPFRPGNSAYYYQFQPAALRTDLHVGDNKFIRVYALDGDVINLTLGDPTPKLEDDGMLSPHYSAAMPVRLYAGRDIVNFGRGAYRHSYYSNQTEFQTPSLILNNDQADISIIHAGRDILYANVQVAGPGSLEVSAGRNIYQGNVGSLTSVGPIVEGDTRPGASIVVQAGAGAAGPDYAALKRYLDPAYQADLASGNTLAGQVGKVAHTYEDELTEWLKQRHGYEAADAQDALAYFNAMAPEQQRIFLRTVYYTELRESGREYNDVGGTRYGSYLRGRQAIAALFPESDAQGKAITRSGNYVAFGKSGIQTQFGGDIQMLVPGGGITLGLQGEVPAVTSGLITQGSGDIQLYSERSMLLGLSRIMTTFGGDILAWSAKGDINAGRGSKTTLVYTPPKRVYDAYGNVTLSPDAPSSGAGIATLNPIAEVEPGDIDLIAPLGTIDAGEAGIRVSGNVNIAALHVVNAANIQVQGESTGIPVAAVVNTGALTSASAASTSAATAAQDSVSRARNEARQNQPSIFSVQILGFGGESSGGSGGAAASEVSAAVGAGASMGPANYQPDSVVRVLGLGANPSTAADHLTAQERSRMAL